METETTATEPVEAPEESGSLSDHEASYGVGGTGLEPPSVAQPVESAAPPVQSTEPVTEPSTDRDQQGRFQKHRAKSQQAQAGDVPRINELTQKLRAAERRAEEAEKRASTRPEPERRVEPAKPQTPAGETFTFPTFDEYQAQHPETDYEAWQDARFDARLEHRDQQRAATAAVEQRNTAGRQLIESYATKKAEFTKTHPDFDAIVESCQTTGLTPVLESAILTDDNSAALVYYLAQHPEFYDEMLLLTDGKPLDEHYVALAQRRLRARAQTASTGSVAPPRLVPPAPRPPNPVRTGPMQTGDDLPGDDSSLADHEKAFGQKRRR